MWTPTAREQHSRAVARYQTDLTDAEWRVISPLLPEPCATGRPREWPMREIVNGIFYVLRGGIAWRLLPSDFPPWQTEAGGPRGYDACKKINGRERHALVDTDGRGLIIEPHPASVQDRDGGVPLLQASRAGSAPPAGTPYPAQRWRSRPCCR